MSMLPYTLTEENSRPYYCQSFPFSRLKAYLLCLSINYGHYSPPSIISTLIYCDVFKIFPVVWKSRFPQNIKIQIYTRWTPESEEDWTIRILMLLTYPLNQAKTVASAPKTPQKKQEAESTISAETRAKPLSCEKWIWITRSWSQKQENSE